MASVLSTPAVGVAGPSAGLTRTQAIGALLSLLLLAVTLLGPVISYKPAPFTGEGSPVRQAAYILLAVLAAANARPWARPERLFVIPFALTIGLVWCWLSLAWSFNFSISLRRLALMTLAMWTIFLTVRQSTYQETLKAIRIVLVICLVANYIAALAFPSFGVHQAATETDKALVGAWRGIMMHKNNVGAASAFTVIVFLFDPGKMKAALRWGIILAALFCLHMSMSKTSMGILAIAAFSGWIYIRYNPAYRVLLIPLFCIAAATLYLLAIIYWQEISAPFGDPAGFTGRVRIWEVTLQSVSDKIWYGWGYGGFWNTGPNTAINRYTDDWVTSVGTAHSGYIDLILQVGIPGLVLVVAGAIVWPVIKLLTSQRISRGAGALLLALLLFCAGHNLTETSLFYRDEVIQVALCFTLALIWQETGPWGDRPAVRRRGRRAAQAAARPLPTTEG